MCKREWVLLTLPKVQINIFTTYQNLIKNNHVSCRRVRRIKWQKMRWNCNALSPHLCALMASRFYAVIQDGSRWQWKRRQGSVCGFISWWQNLIPNKWCFNIFAISNHSVWFPDISDIPSELQIRLRWCCSIFTTLFLPGKTCSLNFMASIY